MNLLVNIKIKNHEYTISDRRLNANCTLLQCVSNGIMSLLHLAIDMGVPVIMFQVLVFL